VRILRLVAALVCSTTAARAQIAPQQPSIKVLVLPLVVKTPADSLAL